MVAFLGRLSKLSVLASLLIDQRAEFFQCSDSSRTRSIVKPELQWKCQYPSPYPAQRGYRIRPSGHQGTDPGETKSLAAIVVPLVISSRFKVGNVE